MSRSDLIISSHISDHNENPLENGSPGLLCKTSITLRPQIAERRYKKTKLQANISHKQKTKIL